jgi:DNA-binding transcriptional ArsR family regulator
MRSPILDRLVDVVRDEDDRLAQLALQAQELVLEALAVDRVDRAERLVHEHERRIRGQSARDADPLALATGELRGVAVADLGGVQPDEVDQHVDALADALLLPAQDPGDRGDVLADGLVREQTDLLNRVADLAAQVGGALLTHGLAVEEDVAARHLDHPVHEAHRGRLAAARRADENADLAGGHDEAQVRDRGLGGLAKDLAHVAELEGGRLRVRRRPSEWAVVVVTRTDESQANRKLGNLPRGAGAIAPPSVDHSRYFR